MDYDNFLKIVKEQISDFWISGYECHLKNDIITMKWETGGYEGGNCWDNTEPYPFDSDIEAPTIENDILADILSRVSPDISFCHVVHLHKMWSDIDSDYENEYYGNCIYYDLKTINTKDVWDYLVKNDLL